jgi:hypothetical protein
MRERERVDHCVISSLEFLPDQEEGTLDDCIASRALISQAADSGK